KLRMRGSGLENRFLMNRPSFAWTLPQRLQGFAHRVYITFMKSRTQFNSLKRRALEVFAMYGPLNPRAWAPRANMFPIRSAYSYLLRLHRFGLLDRAHDSSGFLIYAISERGRAR